MADHYYVAPFVGAGVDNDPYRPKGADEGGEWAAVDIRPDATAASGWCLVNFDSRRSDESGMFYLGDVLDVNLPPPAVTWVQNNLGVDVSGQSVRGAIIAVVNDKLNVQPDRDGKRRIRLRGLIHEE